MLKRDVVVASWHISGMILMPQIFDINENTHFNELENWFKFYNMYNIVDVIDENEDYFNIEQNLFQKWGPVRDIQITCI